jgi:hypothetical protein
VHGYAGLHRAEQGRRVGLLDPAWRKAVRAWAARTSAWPQSPRATASSDPSQSASARSSCASDVPLEDISQLIGHAPTTVTETVYRHEIRPALTKGAAAIDKIFAKAPESA